MSTQGPEKPERPVTAQGPERAVGPERMHAPLTPRLEHEPTCAYAGLEFKRGSGNKVCSCPGRVKGESA